MSNQSFNLVDESKQRFCLTKKIFINLQQTTENLPKLMCIRKISPPLRNYIADKFDL